MGRRGEGASLSSVRPGGCSGRLKRPRDERGEVWEPTARGIDGRPRSAARQWHGRACWVPRRRRGASPSSCRLRRARRLSGAQQDDGTGEGEVSGGRAGRVLMARQRAAGQWRSERTRGALECLRSCAEQRGEGQRERREKEEWREKRKEKKMSTV